MRILAFDCSVMPGTVAVLCGTQVLKKIELPRQLRTTQTLAPALVDVITNVDWTPRDIQLVATTTGPGSFTGLRVGVTTAKTFAYASGASILGINTLRVVLRQAKTWLESKGNEGDVSAVMDAQRGQLFWARSSGDEIHRVSTPTPIIIDADRWVNELSAGEWVTGPGLKKVKGSLPSLVTIVDETIWSPQAAIVGQLAFQDYESGRRDDFWKLTPEYFRKSAAEEKAASG